MTTEIERYLKSLPKDILTIDICYKDIESLPDLEKFEKLEILYCTGNKLTSLTRLPKNLKRLYCSGNKLTSLPNLEKFENLEQLHCSNNKLTSLTRLPKNLKELHCHYNKITLLPTLPENLETLNCSGNKLTLLPNLEKFEKLELLHCVDNELTLLPTLPENLKRLYCYDNELTSLRNLPQNLKLFHCNSPNFYFLYSNNFMQTKKNIQIFINFRHLYYCLKLKKQLRKWLWEKVREPNIKKMYSPDYLIKNLGDEDDLDTVINNWENNK